MAPLPAPQRRRRLIEGLRRGGGLAGLEVAEAGVGGRAVGRRQRLVGAGVRAAGLAFREHAVADRHGGAPDEREDGAGGDDHPRPVPAHERPQEVRRRRGPREDRLAREPATQVVEERGDAGISLGRVARDRLRDDHRDVGVDRGRERGERHGLVLHEHPQGRRERQRGDVVRRAPGEELVGDRAERVDVGPGVHAADVGAGLLGAHVGEGAEEHAGRRVHRGRGFGRGREPRDAEIEHLRPALRVHEDVRGLEVAVHHPRGVRVRDRRAGAREQVHRRPHVGARPAPRRDRDAVHELHREERERAGRRRGGPGGEQPRDARVVEAAEHLRLVGEPPDHLVAR